MHQEITTTLRGDLTIKRSKELQKELVEALSGQNDIKILLDNPDNIDVTLIQLLTAAKREAETSAKRIKVSGNITAELEDLLSKAGFDLF